MNIFYFSADPIECARDLCDKHVVKMTTETVQIISSAYYLLTNTAGVYKPTHLHHPCVEWASKSKHNFVWLCGYALALDLEYNFRYKKTHLAVTKLRSWLISINLDTIPFPELLWTPPPQCMPDQYKQSNTCDAYKEYYKGEKHGFSRWKFTQKPNWF